MYCIQDRDSKEYFNSCNFIAGRQNFLFSSWQMAFYEDKEDKDFLNLLQQIELSGFYVRVMEIHLQYTK